MANAIRGPGIDTLAFSTADSLDALIAAADLSSTAGGADSACAANFARRAGTRRTDACAVRGAELPGSAARLSLLIRISHARASYGVTGRAGRARRIAEARTAIDRLATVVPDLAAPVGAGFCFGVGLALRMLPLLHPLPGVLAVARLAPPPPVLALRLIEPAKQAAGERQHDQQPQQAAART